MDGLDEGLLDEEEAETDPESEEEDDESGPAVDFGLYLGVPLALIALVLAFVGPVRILTLFRYELPIVASFRSPLELTYFAYLGGASFLFALGGAVAFPLVRSDDALEYLEDGDVSGYEVDLALGLIMPAAALAVLMAVAGFLFPALFYLVGGELIRAGQILLMVIVVVVLAVILQTIAMLVIAVWSSPLLIPSFLGSYLGGFLRQVMDIGPDLTADRDQWSLDNEGQR